VTEVGRIGPVRFVAPVLRVADLEASVEWYRTRLGVAATFVSPPDAAERLAALSLGGPVVLWELRRDRGPAPAPAHLVVVVDGPLPPIRDRLVAAGAEVNEIRAGSDNELFDVFDPDGNRLEVSRPATPAAPP
jgi:catechol 2,3-dioxygenase-like lactoylglutathione lyase family enzyme